MYLPVCNYIESKAHVSSRIRRQQERDGAWMGPAWSSRQGFTGSLPFWLQQKSIHVPGHRMGGIRAASTNKGISASCGCWIRGTSGAPWEGFLDNPEQKEFWGEPKELLCAVHEERNVCEWKGWGLGATLQNALLRRCHPHLNPDISRGLISQIYLKIYFLPFALFCQLWAFLSPNFPQKAQLKSRTI